MDHAVKGGDKAPDFKLKNTENQDVNLSTLLAKGPVVLTFYRGKY
jgi:peroxiredoxin